MLHENSFSGLFVKLLVPNGNECHKNVIRIVKKKKNFNLKILKMADLTCSLCSNGSMYYHLSIHPSLMHTA